MEKKHFFIKLIAPRPTFPQDMTEVERGIMQQHIAYWRALTEKGISIVFGPVLDPEGSYGIGIVEVTDDQEAKDIVDNDPTILSSKGFSYHMFPMRIGMIRS